MNTYFVPSENPKNTYYDSKKKKHRRVKYKVTVNPEKDPVDGTIDWDATCTCLDWICKMKPENKLCKHILYCIGSLKKSKSWQGPPNVELDFAEFVAKYNDTKDRLLYLLIQEPHMAHGRDQALMFRFWHYYNEIIKRGNAYVVPVDGTMEITSHRSIVIARQFLVNTCGYFEDWKSRVARTDLEQKIRGTKILEKHEHQATKGQRPIDMFYEEESD